MALSIKNRETEALARELARITNKPITKAVHEALFNRLNLAQQRQPLDTTSNVMFEKLMEISRRAAAYPVLNNLTEDEILGYDEYGAPTL